MGTWQGTDKGRLAYPMGQVLHKSPESRPVIRVKDANGPLWETFVSGYTSTPQHNTLTKLVRHSGG